MRAVPLIVGSLLLVGAVVALVLLVYYGWKSRQTKKTPMHVTVPDNNLVRPTDLQGKIPYFDGPLPMYWKIVAQTLVPTPSCCSPELNFQTRSKDTYDILIGGSQYLGIEKITIPTPIGSVSFYSVQAREHGKPSRGWYIEKEPQGFYKLFQDFGENKVYLGLSVDRKTIQGFFKDQTNLYAALQLRFQ